MEIEYSEAYDGVKFFFPNEKEPFPNQAKERYEREDKEESLERLLTASLSLVDTPNQQSQQLSDGIQTIDDKKSLEKHGTETNEGVVDQYGECDFSKKGHPPAFEKRENATSKSYVDQHGMCDFSKQGLHQISPQLMPCLASVQMLYLQVTL